MFIYLVFVRQIFGNLSHNQRKLNATFEILPSITQNSNNQIKIKQQKNRQRNETLEMRQY